MKIIFDGKYFDFLDHKDNKYRKDFLSKKIFYYYKQS